MGNNNKNNKKNTIPPVLRRGDTIGIFCPSGPVRNEALMEEGIRLLCDMGFQVKLQGRTQSGHAWLADSDAARADALNSLWFDPEIRVILAIRGGFGCLRLLPLLDLDALASQPKLLAGFSDVTVLLNVLSQQAGVLGIHGPVLASLLRSDQESMHSLLHMLGGVFPRFIKSSGLEILRPGSGYEGRGRLMGGNLCSLVHLLGTPWDLDYTGRILLLEDTNEPMYRLDRMLTHLNLAGRLNGLAGLILGDFDTGGDNHNDNLRLREAVWQRVLELAPPGFPIWAGFPFGHGRVNQALPLGMEAIMHSNQGTLELFP